MRGSEVVRHVRKETGLVGRNVESLRKAQGLSKTCLSAMAGVCRQELAKVEKGEVNATLGTLIRLADALDVAVGDVRRADGRVRGWPPPHLRAPCWGTKETRLMAFGVRSTADMRRRWFL